jgi:hypothetical protein
MFRTSSETFPKIEAWVVARGESITIFRNSLGCVMAAVRVLAK